MRGLRQVVPFRKSGCPTGILSPLYHLPNQQSKHWKYKSPESYSQTPLRSQFRTIYARYPNLSQLYPPTYELTAVHPRQTAPTASENPLIVPIPHPPMSHARIHTCWDTCWDGERGTGDGDGRDERGISYPSQLAATLLTARFRLYILSPHPVVRPLFKRSKTSIRSKRTKRNYIPHIVVLETRTYIFATLQSATASTSHASISTTNITQKLQWHSYQAGPVATESPFSLTSIPNT